MQYLDLFSCHYRSLCEISVFRTALVATVFLQKCTAKSKAVSKAMVTKRLERSTEQEQE